VLGRQVAEAYSGLVDEVTLMPVVESKAGAVSMSNVRAKAKVEAASDFRQPIPKPEPIVDAKATIKPRFEPEPKPKAIVMVKAASRASRILVVPIIEQSIELATIQTRVELASTGHFRSVLEAAPVTVHS
jgi:hypothetical protein